MDSSAYVKIPLEEPERDALVDELERWPRVVSSALLEVEVIRACAQRGRAAEARRDLEEVSILELAPEIRESAAKLAPLTLRSLDALHLATALSLRDDLGVVIAYDVRLLEAAQALGLPTASPR